MKVILSKDVAGQGKKGDLVTVSDGYARNYLIKNNLAVEATSTVINAYNMQQESKAHHAREEKKAAEELAKALNNITVTVKVKVGANGKLFGALNTGDIATALSKAGTQIDKKKIVLKDPIKALGTYKVAVKVYPEISATVQVLVEAE